MKIIQYLIVFVFFGLISTGIAADESTLFNIPDNETRYGNIYPDAQLLMPRTYAPLLPENHSYLDRYTPDNYCNLGDLNKIDISEVKACFKSKQRWLRLQEILYTI